MVCDSGSMAGDSSLGMDALILGISHGSIHSALQYRIQAIVWHEIWHPELLLATSPQLTYWNHGNLRFLSCQIDDASQGFS